MQPTDRAEFVRVLNGLAAIKGKDLTPEAISLWWSAMSRWSIPEFKAAASHLVTSCQFMPSPYDFEQLRKAGEPTAGEAWAIVLSGVPLTGRVAKAAAAVGGQAAIRFANIERDLPHFERRFKEAYEDIADADRVREQLPEIARTNPMLEQLNLASLRQLGWSKPV